MNFEHTEERQMLADMAGRFVRDQYPIEKRHEIAASTEHFSRDIWQKMAEPGLIGALFDENSGGFGGSGFDIAVLFEEIGRGLVVEPFLPTLLAAQATRGALEGWTSKYEQVISGEILLAYGHGEPGSRYTLEHVETVADADGDDWLLNGHKSVVLGGQSAEEIIVSARTSGATTDRDGITHFVIGPDMEGVTIRPYGTIDGYGAADVILENVRVLSQGVVGEIGRAFEDVSRAHAWGALAVSAEALGAIEVAIDMTLDYLRTRKQFGVPIGKFQALQHRMADLMGEREQIRSALINAAGHMESADRDWYVSALKNLVGRSGRMIAEEAIQMHGGIGMTWEYAVGHYAKRIVMIDHLFGDEDHHLEVIARANGKAA